MLARSILAAMLVAMSAVSSWACEIRVRDAAFRTVRDVHRLCVMGNSGDPQADSIFQQLSAWLSGPGRGLNLQLERVNADAPDIRWSDYAVPSAPSKLPVVALVGRDRGAGESFLIEHWEPGPDAADLERLKNSPARVAMSTELGSRLAVLLFSPAVDTDSKSSEQLLAETVKKWTAQTKLGVSVVQVDRTDQRERTLLAFMGIKPDTPDWVGVVFGRGKLMAPPLVGDEISRKRLDEMIDQLTQDCACSKPLPSMGVDIPLVWNEARDAAVIPFGDPTETADAADDRDALPSVASDIRLIAAPTLPSIADANGPATPGMSLLAIMVWTFTALAGAVLAISFTVLWRSK